MSLTVRGEGELTMQAVRWVLAGWMSALACLAATAEPLTSSDLVNQLAAHGVESLGEIVIGGEPVVTGQVDGQSFKAVLRECETGRCEWVEVSSCVPFEGAWTDALQRVNAYNQSVQPGSAYARRDSQSVRLCAQLITSLEGPEGFTTRDLLNWRQLFSDLRELPRATRFAEVENTVVY